MPAHDASRHELMAAQLGVWYAPQLRADEPVYNMGEYLEIRGELDVGLFEVALRQVMREAEALRLRFGHDEGQPWQRVADAGDWPLPVIDVAAAPDPRAAALEWMWADMRRPVEVSGGPHFTHALFAAGPGLHLWYIRGHHVAVDAYSGSLLAARQAQVYTGLLAGDPAAGAPLQPYQVMLDAEASYRASASFARDRQFWLAALDGAPEAVSVSGHRVPPARRFPARDMRDLGPGGTARARSAAQRLNTSLAGVMVSATAAFVHQCTGAQDLLLGLPALGRAGRRLRGIPAMTANVLPVRLTVTPVTTLGEVAAQATAAIRAGLAHQRYRYEDILRDQRLVDGAAMFAATVNVMPFDYGLRFGDCTATACSLASGPVGDLRISAFDGWAGDGIQVAVDANRDLYDAGAGREVADAFHRVLHWVSTAPAATPVAASPLTAGDPPGGSGRRPAAGREDGEDGGAADAGRPQPLTLPQMLAAVMARTPDATAVSCGETALSYGALDAASGRLADLLTAAGAGPETIVAVLMDRSPALVTVLAAVMRAGAAYRRQRRLAGDNDSGPRRPGGRAGGPRAAGRR
jgi:hypothetical protein